MADGRLEGFKPTYVSGQVGPMAASGRLEGFTPTFVSGTQPKDPERTVLGTLGDVGVTALKGAVGLPAAFVGLADIPTGGRVGKALEEIGYRPEETQKILDTWYSDAQQAANAKVQQAEGFVPTLTTALQNPSTILTAAGESLPQMLGGAGIARGLLKAAPKVAPWVAGAVGEGVLGAGAAASQIRGQTEDGLLTPGQSGAALASGVGTGLLGAAGGRLANRLGLGDVDTALAQGALGTGNRGLTRNVLGSALSEGVFEELPQSMQEQVWQNVALGRPWDEGVGKAGAVGMLAGGLTGGGFGALNNRAVESNLLRREEDAARQERERQEQLAPILGMIRPDSGLGTQAVIDQQLGIDPDMPAKELEKQRKQREADILAAFNEPSGVRVAGADGQERELSAIEASLMQQGLPTAPIIETPAPAAPPSRVYSPEEQELITMGIVPNGNALNLLGEIKASGLPMESLTPVITAMTERKNAQAKKLLAQAIIESKKAPAAAPTAPTPAGGLRVAVTPDSSSPLVPPNLRLPTAEQIAADQQANPRAWGPSLQQPTTSAAPTPPVAQAPGVTSLPVQEDPTDVQASQAVQAEAQGEAPLAAAAAQGAAPAAEPIAPKSVDQLTDEEWTGVIGPIQGAARADGPNEEIGDDDAILLKKMVVKTIKDGVAAGKSREQIVAQIEALTKGGVSNTGMVRINALLESQPATQSPTEPVVQRKRRVVNTAAMQQSQAFVAPEPVAQEEVAADPTDESDWEDSKPDGAPALTALTPSLQQVWSEARAAKAQGRRVNLFKVAEDLVAEQGDEVADDDTLTTLNQIFGERDAAMLFDRYVDNMTEEAIANKYGLSRQAVAKVTGEGELGQKTRAARIEAAKKKFGWTDEFVDGLLDKFASPEVLVDDRDFDSDGMSEGRTNLALEATEAAFGAGQQEAEDPGMKDAGFGTATSIGGAQSNWKDTLKAGDKALSEEDQEKLGRLNARIEILDKELEGAGNADDADALRQERDELLAKVSTIEAGKLRPQELAARFTQLSMDLQDRVAKRQQQIEQARAAGKTEVSVNNKLVPIAQLEQEAADLQARVQEALDRAESVLMRGNARKAKGAEPKVEKPKVRRVKKADAAAPAAPAAATAPAEVLTPTESAARAWDQAANTIPGAPKWADLPPAQQREFVGYGENNWTRQDVVAMMQRGTSDAKFGKDSKTKGKGTYTAAELIEEIKGFIRADVLGRKIVIVDTIGDLLNSSDRTRKIVGAEMALNSAYGVAANGVGYLVADRIRKGSGRAKFMHEVGVHLGLENLLPKAVYDKLTQQIVNWAKADDGSLESEIALDATERVMEAGTKKEDRRAEMLAYFVEVAMERGIDPTAEVMQGSKGLREWFRTLWAAFKVAARRLGMKPETLTAQDVVNLAFGAARLEVVGTWHGTAASFRRFNHKFMNSGEGAQAFGWGTYLAQRFGIAKGYWTADVQRKTTDEKFSVKYNGVEAGYIQDVGLNGVVVQVMGQIRAGKSLQQAIDAVVARQEELIVGIQKSVNSARRNNLPGLRDLEGSLEWSKADLKTAKALDPAKFEVVNQKYNTPEGSLMRVDVAVADDEFLDWNKPLTEQSAKVRSALQKAGRTYGSNDASARGRDLYEDLTAEFSDDAEAVSKYLDSIGIKGVKFLDARSRGTATNAVRFEGKEYNRDELRDELRAANQAKDWDRVAALAVLSDVLSDGVDATISDLEGRIGDLESQFIDISKNSAERFGVQWNEAEARQKATADALATPQGKRLSWLRQNKDSIELIEKPKTRNLVIFNDKNIFRVGTQVAADKDRMRFGKDLREKLPAELQKPVGTITNVLSDTKNAALNMLTFTEDVINRAIGLGVKAAGDLRRVYQERAALTGKLEREVERVADLYNKVPEAERGTGPRSVNQFLYDATREGKWGFKPSWRKGTSANVKVDADMKQRYDALSKESKALVEAIFRHGDEVLSLKKQTVMAATDSEYDALIAAAQKANDTKKAARLTADKADQIKRFSSLFALQEFRPYAPLKRFGDYVVIARSQKYLDADEKTRAKLENSGDDYHVSFAESAAAAREMVEQLNKQGAFAEVVFRQKEAVQQTMFGGMMSAFNKLRADLDSELADAQPGEKAAIRAARKVIGELYLSSLAEASARKSEMRRRGVAGEIDMLRSFTTQGRADAQFIAGAKYNNQTLDVFNAMRREVKSGDAEAQNTKSGVFNELMKRHTQSMDYDPSPIADKLARTTSIWFLATSPAYYLQNLTQPFMMSMPFMTKRHNYLKIGGALLKAYSDLAPMFRTAKLGEQFNYASAPQDVRAAISTLVDRGRIDIGMDTDLGTFRLEGEGPIKDRWNKVDRGIRSVSQKMEAVNRLATAIAAYRMELAKTGDTKGALDYADEVITQTHGDYTRTNAPRAFNTATGKVALQFRKFQLIQLTLLAKLIKNSFTGKDRAAAFKALSFTLAHTAVMAGAIGLPGFAAVSWALGALMGGGDEEPFNTEQELREFIGNEKLATLITRGVPAALGVDLSQKLGSGNVLSLLPFNDLDLSSRSGVESAAFAAFGGPAGGLTLRAVDGMSLMRDGQYYRGLEQMMPTGVTNAMKAYRTANEGVTRRNGDELISPDEISGMETFWQAIGFQPTQIAERQFRDKVKRDADEKFQSRAEKIRNAFLRAKDDPDARAEARERWAALQDAREEAGYRRQPLSSLMRAEQNQRERERNTLGGIQFNRDTRRFVEDLVTEEED